MRHGKLQITEIVEGGSVPELRVVNRYDRPVLILDGEEADRCKAKPGAQYYGIA